jgi:cobalt-zinc-cadmium efflux system membrane fusion protein
VVTQRHATVGNMVGLDQALFQIVDTSVMWAELDVPEHELAQVAVGQEVVVTLDDPGDRELAGTISYLAPEIDAHTRTARARVALANPGGLLRANQFGQARVVVSGAHEVVAVPRAAVQRAKGVPFVFVRLAEDEYEARRVQVGAAEGEVVEITKGVRPGEEVVTQGSFLLKTETLKDSIGAGCCDPE